MESLKESQSIRFGITQISFLLWTARLNHQPIDLKHTLCQIEAHRCRRGRSHNQSHFDRIKVVDLHSSIKRLLLCSKRRKTGGHRQSEAALRREPLPLSLVIAQDVLSRLFRTVDCARAAISDSPSSSRSLCSSIRRIFSLRWCSMKPIMLSERASGSIC